MRSRIELNPDLESLAIPQLVVHEMCSHALETDPEECCGLVTGTETERFLSVYRCRNEMTMKHRADPNTFPRDGREAFYMNESDLLKSQQDAESHGQRVTAVYHSHAGAGLYFSEMDQEYADQPLFPFPDAAHFVIEVLDRRTRVGVFERAAGDEAFVGRAVEAEAP